MKVSKAWQFLLVCPHRGYYTGYKGDEMFGDLERAKMYRTRDEAFMDTLTVKHKLELEQVLIWHRTVDANGPRAVKLGEAPAVSMGDDVASARHARIASQRANLKLVHSR